MNVPVCETLITCKEHVCLWVWSDEVKFGEVVLQPPVLSITPRRHSSNGSQVAAAAVTARDLQQL